MVNSLARIATQIDSELVMPMRAQSIGRQVIERNNKLSGKGIGMQSVDHYVFGDLSAALMDYQLPENDQDTVDVTSVNTKMVYMKKTFKIPRTAYESFRLNNIPIDTDAAVTIADLIAQAENTLFIYGWAPDGTNYKVNGLYKAAGNIEETTDAFSTYGKAIEKVTLAQALLQADGVYGPYNLILNVTQFNELLASESTTGRPEFERVLDIINGGENKRIGGIFVTTALADTYGILCGIGKKYYDFVEAQPISTELGTDSEHPQTGPIIGTLYEAVVPRIKQADAICKLTGI